MRGRILLAGLLGLAALAACSRKDSLYIDTSKDAPAPVEAQNSTQPLVEVDDRRIESAGEAPSAASNR